MIKKRTNLAKICILTFFFSKQMRGGRYIFKKSILKLILLLLDTVLMFVYFFMFLIQIWVTAYSDREHNAKPFTFTEKERKIAFIDENSRSYKDSNF